MDKKTITTDAYIARDGKPFLDAGECIDYERNVLDKLENIKYFRVRFAPDLTETGCFTKCFYCAVYSENNNYHYEILEYYCIKDLGYKIISEGVMGYGYMKGFNIERIDEEMYRKETGVKEPKIFLSPELINGFPKNVNYKEKWDLK